MLGRKQSLRGELLPYEPAQEEANNESVGIDWMNKVIYPRKTNSIPHKLDLLLYGFTGMDAACVEIERFSLSLFSFSQHAQNF